MTRFDLVAHIDFGGGIVAHTNHGERGRPMRCGERGDARTKLLLNLPADSLPVEDRAAHAPVRITKGGKDRTSGDNRSARRLLAEEIGG